MNDKKKRAKFNVKKILKQQKPAWTSSHFRCADCNSPCIVTEVQQPQFIYVIKCTHCKKEQYHRDEKISCSITSCPYAQALAKRHGPPGV